MKIVLLNSGGLDSAYKAKTLKEAGHEIYSLFVEIKDRPELEADKISAEETAKRYCDSHHIIYLDFGYSPAHWLDDQGFKMYDGTKSDRPLHEGPPNMSSVFLSLGVSYAMAIGADMVSSGLHAEQLKDAALNYESAMNANHSPYGKLYPKPKIDTNDEYTSKSEFLLAKDDKEFDYIARA